MYGAVTIQKAKKVICAKQIVLILNGLNIKSDNMKNYNRFIEGETEDIENQYLTDNDTEKDYWIDHGLSDIVKLMNELNDEREFFIKIITFFAKNPMTKYSSVKELLLEMNAFEEMGLI